MKSNQITEALQQKGISCPDLLESMSDGVALYEAVDNGQDFVFCEHNPAAEKITKIPRDQVIGRRVTDVFPGIEELGLLDVFRRVFKSGKREEHPYRQYRDGRIILWVQNSVFRLPDGKIVAVYRDITEQQNQQSHIKHLSLLRKTGLSIHRHLATIDNNQELLQAICDVFVTDKGYRSAWLALIDEKGCCDLTANSGLLKDFNLLTEEMKAGKLPPCILRTIAEKKPLWQSSQKNLCKGCSLANGYPDAGIMTAPLQYGSKVYGVLTVSLDVEMVTMSDEQELFTEMARDIGLSLFNRAQDIKLQDALDEYADLYNNAPDMFISVEAGSAQILHCNQTLLTTLGYERDEIIGQPVFKLYYPVCVDEVKEVVFPTFCKTGIISNKELLLQRKDGSSLPVSLDVSAIRDVDNKIIQSRSIFHDISARKKLEEQMLVSEKMTTIAGLAAGVAHEINTPLSGILQALQLIEIGLDPDNEQNHTLAASCGIDLTKLQDYLQQKELDFFLDGIRNSATKAANIISDLLQFSRPQESTPIRANLTELIDRSIELAKTDFKLKKEFNILGVEFIRKYSRAPLHVNCLTMEIEQVLINLIKNACQAMAEEDGPAHPQIILRTEQHNNMAVIEVEDNGPGIKEAIQSQIFDPFFTTKDVGQGTGLGLSVSYSIITDKHGGTIRAESTPRKGARVIIELPFNKGENV